MSTEIWKDIDGFDGRYQVSTWGRVKNQTGILSPISVRRGYLTVDLKGKRFMIHRLVAQSFLENFSLEKQVHHKDGNNQNNNIENLECLTQTEHMRLHRLIYPIAKKCLFCGKTFEPDPTKRSTAKFCDRKCYVGWMQGKHNKESRRKLD